MTQTETRNLGYAIAGSLAVHLLLAVSFALWIGLASFHHIPFPRPPAPDEQPEVTLVFPDPVPVPPTQPAERYIRTTQNTDTAQAPENADFVSDRNTVASARSAPSPDGDRALPSMQGVDYATKELADRTFRDGETKNDSAPAPPRPTAAALMSPAPPPSPTAPPSVLRMKVPDQPLVAKKDQSRTETMMRELDTALAAKDKPDTSRPQETPPQERAPTDPMETTPNMRSPLERAVPRAIPVATPVANTPRQEKDAFQPETHRSATKGGITNAGSEDAVNAASTPVGRYMRQVTGAIEKKWHQYRRDRADAVEPGKMGLRFFVNKNGKVEDLEFTFKESNALMEDFTIEAILKAEIPPIPKDLLPILEKERVEINYDIVIHP